MPTQTDTVSENECMEEVAKILGCPTIYWDDESSSYCYMDEDGMERYVAQSLWELRYTIFQSSIGKAIL